MTEPCDECRFGPESVDDVAAEIGVLGRKFAAPLSRFLPGEDGTTLVRTRPEPDVWSPLEYACHVRDVLRVFDERTGEMAREPGGQLVWWDPEAAVTAESYNDQDPADVATAIDAAAKTYHATLASLSPEQRAATSERRPGEIFTVDELAVLALHEARHHLLDIGRGLRRSRGR